MKKIAATILFYVCGSMAANAQNHCLWYSSPASHWLEALPVGNSHLGAMVYGKTDVEGDILEWFSP